MPDLATWLLEQIELTTELERLDWLAEVIALDKGMDAVYLSNPSVLGILRRAWAEKKTELLDIEKQIGNSVDVVSKTTQTNEPSGQPA